MKRRTPIAEEIHPHNPLYWFGPGLVRAGLMKNEDWVIYNTSVAAKMFSTADMKLAASLVAASHRYAIDYLTQAPVLVPAACGGEAPISVDQRNDLVASFRSLCAQGLKLPDMLRYFKLAPQLRAIRPRAAHNHYYKTYLDVSATVPPSTLAQVIPQASIKQKHWLENLQDAAQWIDTYSAEAAERSRFLGWCAREMCSDRVNAGTLADLYRHNPERWNYDWTYDRALQKAQEWHAQLARATSAERFLHYYGIAYDAKIAFPIPLRTEPDANGIHLVALNSGDALHEEGAAMHHCVASYTETVVRGLSFIYGVRKGGQRLSTVELVRGGKGGAQFSIRQHMGVCNSKPDKDATKAATAFLRGLNKCHHNASEAAA